MQKVIRILLVDDFSPFRQAVTLELRKHDSYEIVGEACDGSEAIHLARELSPDIVLMDIALPSVNGIVAAKGIQIVSPCSRILFISSECHSEIVHEALRTGATGYLLKSLIGRELVPALEAVSRGEWFISRGIDIS